MTTIADLKLALFGVGPNVEQRSVLGRFLSWDPSYVGKPAWIRSGSVVVGDIRAASSSI